MAKGDQLAKVDALGIDALIHRIESAIEAEKSERPFKNTLVSARVVGGPSLGSWANSANPYLPPIEVA